MDLSEDPGRGPSRAVTRPSEAVGEEGGICWWWSLRLQPPLMSMGGGPGQVGTCESSPAAGEGWPPNKEKAGGPHCHLGALLL